MSPKDTAPAFVLIRPQMGENIGAAARAMWNFGLDHMRVVDPRDGWPSPRAVAVASGAGRVLDEAMLCADTGAALEGVHYVFATTARARGLTKPVMTPEAAMARVHELAAKGQRSAILFGPERAGMENDDIARANAIISVPVNPDFASLNLGQCVLLLAYEWRRQMADVEPERMEMAGTETAEAIEVEKLAEHFEQRLDDAGFFFPEAKAENMKIVLRNMWSRMPLTRADVQIFHGMMRQMVRWKERG